MFQMDSEPATAHACGAWPADRRRVSGGKLYTRITATGNRTGSESCDEHQFLIQTFYSNKNVCGYAAFVGMVYCID
jgi:hypothetical protein